MAYAENTSVPIEKSLSEIVSLIKRAGAVRVAQMEEPDNIAVEFFLNERRLRFRVPLPILEQMPKADGRGSMLSSKQRSDRLAAACRQRARALLLVIKAKLESVESKVETFDEAFLSNIVMPGANTTVFEQISEPLRIGYSTGIIYLTPRDIRGRYLLMERIRRTLTRR